MSFTIDDILQIMFFQLVYVILFFVLTAREVGRQPRTNLLWLMVIADVLYIAVLGWLTFTVSLYMRRSASAHIRWYTLLFSILIPCAILLCTFSIYYIGRDVKYKRGELKQHR